ncbi:MAG: hypothetical protein HY770_00320 [Chitinivibrionia bacterium]|nr:hypothetical protein [Chitinivibrionia bacterium]
MIDARGSSVDLSVSEIAFLCDRRRGIGADGVILLETDPASDFRMRYYNSDGGEAELCGNGARCAALFAAGLGIGAREGRGIRLAFSAGAGAPCGGGRRDDRACRQYGRAACCRARRPHGGTRGLFRRDARQSDQAP